MAYNEIHNDEGYLRGPYKAFRTRTGIDVTEPNESVVSTLQQSRVAGGEGIYPIPLVLDEDEYQSKIVPGVLHRAFLLQALFEDIAVGTARLVDAGVLRQNELELILQSEHITTESLRQLWRGQSREQIRFVYAPDLVRTVRGEWVVLEDNVGCVGGVVQARIVRDAYLLALGLSSEPALTSQSDVHRAVAGFLARVCIGPNPSALYGFAGWMSSTVAEPNDFETRGKADCLRSLGVIPAQPAELLSEIRANGVSPQAIINLAATLTPQVRDLAEVIFRDRQVPFFGAPCVGVVASKSFLPFDEDLACLYVSEQRPLRSASSCFLREPPEELPSTGVLKRSNGCQGTDVFFLDKVQSESARKELLAVVRKWGSCSAIVQESMEQSVLEGTGIGPRHATPIEIRPIVYVLGWRTALLGDVLAGRAITGAGMLHGNISRGACFLPVLRERTSQHICRDSTALRS